MPRQRAGDMKKAKKIADHFNLSLVGR
jgi:hypothetical protein